MAPKRPSPLEEPPAASSSEEVVSEEEIDSDVEESEEEEEEKSEQKQQQQHKKATSIPTTAPAVDKKTSKKPEIHHKSSSEDEGSESESDSDHPPQGVADTNAKPITSKPVDDASKLKKPRSKSTAPATVTASLTKSAVKRPVENSGGEGKDSKRTKKVPEAGGGAIETEKEKKSGDDLKKPLFQRLWSEDDEIVILKGMIDYSSKKGTDPVADMDAFHEFIRKSLHIDVTRTQLMDKMRRLKKKYENNAGKGKDGGDRTFSKPHEQNTYDLSKKIWGSEAHNGGGDQAKSNGKAKKSPKNDKRLTPAEKEHLLASLHGPTDAPSKKDTEEQNCGPSQVSNESILFNKSIVASGLDASFMKEGLGLIDSAKRSELEEKWRKMQVAETEIFLRRIELIREQTKLVLDAYKKH